MGWISGRSDVDCKASSMYRQHDQNASSPQSIARDREGSLFRHPYEGSALELASHLVEHSTVNFPLVGLLIIKRQLCGPLCSDYNANDVMVTWLLSKICWL
jgi:hypothetical protein